MTFIRLDDAMLIGKIIDIADLLTELSPALEAVNGGRYLALDTHLAVKAIKFTSQGSVAILAKRVRADDERAALETTVNDTGPGIAPTVLAQAFKRFTQLSNSSERLFRGMGLGLAVASTTSRCWARGARSPRNREKAPHFVMTLPLKSAVGAERSHLPSMQNSRLISWSNGTSKVAPS